MTNPERVYDTLIANRGKLICDDCVAKLSGVYRTQINVIAGTLALTNDFNRGEAACSKCGETKLCTIGVDHANRVA